MDDKTRLFGDKRLKDWTDLRSKILSNPDDLSVWKEATSLLDLRLDTRYFKPIQKILKMRTTTGEGFAVMTLICSLIEFLESCYQGKSYRHGLKKETNVEYGYAGIKFKDFLNTHDPFKTIFTKKVSNPDAKTKTFADDFYTNVRCGLLHEAATKNNWKINTFTKRDRGYVDIVDVSDETCKIIYRDIFYTAILDFYKLYKEELYSDKKDSENKFLRHNFCRKLDMLCEITDSAKWWKI